MENEPPQTRIVLAYASLIVIWSTTPLAVVLSLRDLDSIWSLTLRMCLAAAVATLILRASGQRLLLDRQAVSTYAIGALSMFGCMFFVYLGARHLPSGLISILFGSSPLIVGLLSLAMLPGSRLHALQWSGMLMGLAGLVCMFWRPGGSSDVDMVSVIYELIGVFSYALSSIWLKKRGSGLPLLVQTTGSLWASVIGCLLVLPFFWEARPLHMPGWVSLGALFYSALCSSIYAMLAYFFLIRHIAASTVALTTLVNPMFALLLGVAINHERFRAATLTGMALILGGLLAYYLRDIRQLWLARNARAVVAALD